MYGWGNQDREDQEYEFNAGYDYLSEAYGAEVQQLRQQSQAEDREAAEAQQAYEWLLEQGGMVEQCRTSDDFHSYIWGCLEREGMIRSVVPEGCDRAYWEVCEVPWEPENSSRSERERESADNLLEIPF